MREFLRSAYNVFSVYELALLTAALLLPVILLSAYSYRVTKDRRLVYVNTLSLLGSLLSFTAISYSLQYFWMDVTNGFMQFAFYFNLLALLATLLQLYFYYREEMSQKRFDPDHVTRKHFRFSVDAAIAFTIVLSASIIFSPTMHRVVVGTTILSALMTFMLAHLVARRLLRDK